jgi:hypothetical protein
MILIILVVNYQIWQINNDTKNSPSALGGGIYIMLYFGILIISTIIIAYATRFKSFRKIDYALFILCTPLTSILILFLSH